MARKMKDSGIEWFGEIPEGWEVAPLKRFTSIQTGNTPSKTFDSNYYASTGIPWIKPDNLGYSHSISKTSEHLTSEGALCARIMPPNTVYVCCIGSLGKVGYSSISCACNQQINALIFNDLMFWKYGYYLTIAQESQYLLFGNGNVLQIINSTSQGNIACVLPPLENQHLIACYLDSVCSDIEVLISKTRSSIEEYKKLKQAVITQAVTKGVRGEREMKDCGVEWAGLVPHHWGVAKIGSIGQTSSGATPLRSKESSFFDDATIRWVRTLDLNDGFVYDSSEKITELALASSACSIMPKGTVCVAMYGGAGTIGKCGLLMSDCATNQAVCSIVCNRKIVSPIFLLMQLLALKPYWMKYAVGTRKDPNISQDIVARMKILIPPLDEQKEITDYLDAKCAEIDKLIAKKEQLVKELESYKKSLIYEVVTGKREV